MKKSRTIYLVMVISLLVSGCSNNRSSSSTTSTSSTSSSTSTTSTSSTSSSTSSKTSSSEPEPEKPAIISSKTTGKFIYTLNHKTTGSNISVYNFEGKGEIPYVTFDNYFEGFMKTLYNFEVIIKKKTVDNNLVKFYVKEYEDYASFTVDLREDLITMVNDGGQLFNLVAYYGSAPYLVDGIETKYCKIDVNATKTKVNPTKRAYDLKRYNLDIVRDENNEVYFPYNILNDIFSMNLAATTVFNGKNMYIYPGSFQSGVEDDFVSTSTFANDDTRTKTFAEYTYNEFCFFVENIYGLAVEKNYANGGFSSLMESTGFKTDLLSLDTKKFELAFSEVVGRYIYDGHSGYTRPSLYVNNSMSTYTSKYREGLAYNERAVSLSAIHNDLSKKRKDANKTVGLEIGGDTAIIRFDSFVKATQDTTEYDENVNKYSYSSLHNFDTALMLRKAFINISKEVNVTKVVVDISLNGGGMLDVIPWLEAFFTVDPSVTFMYDHTGEVHETHYKVDLNRDGVVDDNDTFQGKYDFYLLTSEYSFSCGNYFPTVIKEKGAMTLIGHRSGGGECAVGQYSTASGAILRNSSSYHLGYYDNDSHKFVGNDNGIAVDYECDYDCYYNTKALNDFLKTIKK